MPSPISVRPNVANSLSPAGYGALLRYWGSAADYDAGAGNWPAEAGHLGATLAQPTAGKRPTLNAANAAFSGKPTVTFDGVNDELVYGPSALFANVVGDNTMGMVGRYPGAGAANYILGQYASAGSPAYTFYRWDAGTDRMYGDPIFGGGGISGIGIAGVHLWLWSKTGGTVTLYKDGVAVFSQTQATPSGTAGGPGFALMSAGGGGYSAGEIGEFFTIDRAIGATEARALTRYFEGVGYPLV